MSNPKTCSTCGKPQSIPEHRKILEFSLASICNHCFRTCMIEFSRMSHDATVPNEPSAPTAMTPPSLSEDVQALRSMISALLKDMHAKGIKYARINRIERGTIVNYRVQNQWQEAFQQTTAIYLPLLHQLKLLAHVDPESKFTEQNGNITLRDSKGDHLFHLHFQTSTQGLPYVDITS